MKKLYIGIGMVIAGAWVIYAGQNWDPSKYDNSQRDVQSESETRDIIIDTNEDI